MWITAQSVQPSCYGWKVSEWLITDILFSMNTAQDESAIQVLETRSRLTSKGDVVAVDRTKQWEFSLEPLSISQKLSFHAVRFTWSLNAVRAVKFVFISARKTFCVYRKRGTPRVTASQWLSMGRRLNAWIVNSAHWSAPNLPSSRSPGMVV